MVDSSGNKNLYYFFSSLVCSELSDNVITIRNAQFPIDIRADDVIFSLDNDVLW